MTVAKKTAAKPAKTSAALRSHGGRITSAAELHRDMIAYGKEVASTKESALAFLKRIGAPIKTASR